MINRVLSRREMVQLASLAGPLTALSVGSWPAAAQTTSNASHVGRCVDLFDPTKRRVNYSKVTATLELAGVEAFPARQMWQGDPIFFGDIIRAESDGWGHFAIEPVPRLRLATTFDVVGGSHAGSISVVKVSERVVQVPAGPGLINFVQVLALDFLNFIGFSHVRQAGRDDQPPSRVQKRAALGGTVGTVTVASRVDESAVRSQAMLHRPPSANRPLAEVEVQASNQTIMEYANTQRPLDNSQWFGIREDGTLLPGPSAEFTQLYQRVTA